jgi:serine protease Do
MHRLPCIFNDLQAYIVGPHGSVGRSHRRTVSGVRKLGTNNHVVAGAQRIRVILAPATVELVTYHTSLAHRQRAYEASLIGASRKVDLALIKIEEKSLPFIALPEQFRVRLGQTVLAIGSPEGLDHTVTKGIVSAVGRQPELDRPMVYVQTDAPTNPGNRSGP